MDIIKTNTYSYGLLKSAIDAEDIIYIYGPSSSGKTFLAKKALSEYRSIVYAYIDCNVIFNTSKLFIQILIQLKAKLKIPNLRGKSYKIPKVLSLADFLELYESIVDFGHQRGIEKIYIVLDRLDLFYKTPQIDCLISLAGMDNVNLICISIEEPHDILTGIKSKVGKSSLYDRLCLIQLNPWTKSDIVDTICMDEPKKGSELYRTFVNNVVHIVYDSHTKDYLEIKAFCQENFPTFFYEYHGEDLKDQPTNKGKKRKSTRDINVTNVISSFLESIKNMIKQKDMRSYNRENVERRVVIGTSVLIIAAYIAAYTKPSDDKRNFVKFQKRNVPKRIVTQNGGADSVAVSRNFTLERLLHIYKSIILSIQGEFTENDENADQVWCGRQRIKLKAELPDSVLSDVQQLNDINMIEVVSGDVFSSHTHYKFSSIVTREYVDRIAKQIDFSLDHVLGLS